VKVTTDYTPIERRIQSGHERAVADTLAAHRADVTRVTGEYAASLQASTDGLKSRIGSPLPRALAMRFGANVGARRGPHHGPVDTFDDGREYVERMPAAIRGA